MNRLIAIGDIHGCFKSLKILIEDVLNLQPEDKLVLLGDYIDRGNDSKEVVDYIIELQNMQLQLLQVNSLQEVSLFLWK